MIETANYRITGLVDIFDEQNNITGQFPIGSVQELPVEYGTRMVADGLAEAVGAEEVADAETTEDAADAATADAAIAAGEGMPIEDAIDTLNAPAETTEDDTQKDDAVE